MSETVVMCQNCGKRPGTTRYVADGGVMALVHGGYAWWCLLCCLDAQIAYAEERAAALPELREQRRELEERS